MVLRFLLVSAVASLGLDLPSAQDLGAWTRSGRDWVSARLAEWDPRGPVEEMVMEMVEPEAEVGALADAMVEAQIQDLEFSFVMDETVTAFATDLAEHQAKSPAPAIAFEPIEVGDDLYPGLAYTLNREAEGLSRMVPIPPTAVAEPTAPKATPAVETTALDSRVEQLAHAVRLTGQAVHAWAILLRTPPSVTLHP